MTTVKRPRQRVYHLMMANTLALTETGSRGVLPYAFSIFLVAMRGLLESELDRCRIG